MLADCIKWSEEIFSHCKLSDKRLIKRLIKIGGYLSSKIGSGLSSCFKESKSDAAGAYRFIRNDAVSAKEITEGVSVSTAEKAQGRSCLLAIEDTTTLSYRHEVKDQLGYISGCASESSAKGFLVHTVLLYDPEREQTLGIIEQERWSRDAENYGKHHARKSRFYGEKESIKWENASKKVALRLGNQIKNVISVCDREADIFDYLAYKQIEGQRFVVRAAQDRALYYEKGSYLSDVIINSESLGTFDLHVAQKGGRSGRMVKVSIRVASNVEIKIPHKGSESEEEYIKVNVVSVTEINPGTEKAICWVLLTSEPVETFKKARQIVAYYEKRWLIEEFHKCWKSGVKVEKMRMQFSDNLERMIAILAPIALRLLQLREGLGEGKSERSCMDVLDEDEFQVLWRSIEKKKQIPTKRPSLVWAYRAVAKLAGWIDSKNTGKACWSKLWEGWFLLSQRVEGYLLAKEVI